MEIGGLEYNEAVSAQNVIVAVQALVNHVKNTADINNKIESIVKENKKEEKIIMNDEERQLRNLDKLEYMSQYLNEDHIMTQNSL